MNEAEYRLAKTAYFYGWTHEEIEQMDLETFDIYWRGITVIEAENALLAIEAATFPNIQKKQDREKILHRYQKLAHRGEGQSDSISLDQLAKIFGVEGGVNGQ